MAISSQEEWLSAVSGQQSEKEKEVFSNACVFAEGNLWLFPLIADG